MVLLITVACSKDEGVEDEVIQDYTIDLNLAKETNWQMANEILQIVNNYRNSLGLPALNRDQQYASAYAVDHTQYMIEQNKISHDNFPVRSIALKNRGAASVAENVGFGYETAQDLVNAWINSAGHQQVLTGNYTHAGFGVIENDRGNFYFTLLLYRN